MLNVNNLNAFYGEFHVLKDVALSVGEGQVVVMLGPNGHGKSTLLKAICGLAGNVNGEVIYKGQNIKGMASQKLVNMGITYIAENSELFPYISVMENLKLGDYSKYARAN